MLLEALLAYLFVTARKISSFANVLIEPIRGIKVWERIDLEAELSLEHVVHTVSLSRW
jgi:hypothetical protein